MNNQYTCTQSAPATTNPNPLHLTKLLDCEELNSRSLVYRLFVVRYLLFICIVEDPSLGHPHTPNAWYTPPYTPLPCTKLPETQGDAPWGHPTPCAHPNSSRHISTTPRARNHPSSTDEQNAHDEARWPAHARACVRRVPGCRRPRSHLNPRCGTPPNPGG